MIKEVTLNAEGMDLNTHRLICMLSSKYETGEHGNLSDHKAKLCHKGRPSLRVTEQKSGPRARADLTQCWGISLRKA